MRADRHNFVPTGYVLVDKPDGPSSHSAVQQVKRSLGIGGRRGAKAGHAGTLDPFASGLLLVLIGRATRLMPFVVGHDKRYLVDVRFGASSTTDDREGELTKSDAPRPTEAAVRAALPALAAATEQVPPAVSALHIDGERAYRRVRRGEEIEVPARTVRFDSIKLVEWRDDAPVAPGPVAVLDVRCGTGTYMRALARDLGDAVGCPAHCSELRRLTVGEWEVAGAPDPRTVTRAHVRDARELLGDLPQLDLDAAAVREIAAGRRLALPEHLAGERNVALVAADGTLVALAEPTSDGTLLQPRTVLVDPPAPSVQGSSA
jgi:tRNA pseudouridine55 synthase